jgi:hypothetical protein
VLAERDLAAGGGEDDQQNNQHDDASADRFAQGLEEGTHGFLLFVMGF